MEALSKDVLLTKASNSGSLLIDEKLNLKVHSIASNQRLNYNVTQSLFDSNFHENDSLTKTRVVDKIDDFIERISFEDVEEPSSLNDHNLLNDENITIVPEGYCGTPKETYIISDELGDTSFNNHILIGEDNGNLGSVSLQEEIQGEEYDDPPLIHQEEKSANSKNPYSIEIQLHDSTSKGKSNSLSKDVLKGTRGRNPTKSQIKIDKNDPRMRIHFIKFMKKDGQTVKIVECGVCGKEFFHQYTLMRHLTTHTDERNFKCTVCGKGFRQLSTLAQHKATHLEHRPYVCSICHKAFTRVSSLMCHQKTHSEYKNFICQLCGKGFHQKVNLKNHFFTHTNERPYKCDICGQGFNQGSNMQAHKLKHHQGQCSGADGKSPPSFKCKSCSFTTDSKKDIQWHEKAMHGLKSKSNPARVSPAILRNNPSSNASKTLVKQKFGLIEVIKMSNHADKPVDSQVSEVKEDVTVGEEPGIEIGPVDQEELDAWTRGGNIPYALLVTADAGSALVRIKRAHDNKHVIVPASPKTLNAAAEFNYHFDSGSLQLKVPVAAIIRQRTGDRGSWYLDVEWLWGDAGESRRGLDKPEPLPPAISRLEPETPAAMVVAKPDNNSLVNYLITDESCFLKDAPEESSALEVGEEENVFVLSADGDLESGNNPEDDWRVINLEIGSHEEQPRAEFSVSRDGADQGRFLEIDSVAFDPQIDLISRDIDFKGIAVDKKAVVMENIRPLSELDQVENIRSDQLVSAISDKGSSQQKLLLDDPNSITLDANQLKVLMRALQSSSDYEIVQAEPPNCDAEQIFVSAEDAIVVTEEGVQMVMGGADSLDVAAISSDRSEILIEEHRA